MKTIFHSFFIKNKKRRKHKGAGVVNVEDHRTPLPPPWLPLPDFPLLLLFTTFKKALAESELPAYIWTESKFLEMVLPSVQDRNCLESLIRQGNGREAWLSQSVKWPRSSHFFVRISYHGMGNVVWSPSSLCKIGKPCMDS